MCKELNIAGFIDSLVPDQSSARNIPYGEAVVAMTLNGLGFTVGTLHMFPEYHADKPLDKLIREGIKPEHINDKIPGRALDKLFDIGVTSIYSRLAIKVVKHLKRPCKALHLDGTSFHVDGHYNKENSIADENMACIRLCKGYSRDHRPDLNQAILLLLSEHQSGIPLFMQAVSGNKNDSKSFNQVVK